MGSMGESKWDVMLNGLSQGSVVVGGNESGKSEYLLRVGVGVVLAQMGCMIEAEEAVLYPVSLLMTKFQVKHDLHHSSLHAELNTLYQISL